MVVDETLRRLIHEDASEADLAAQAFRKADTLAHPDSVTCSPASTSIEEVLRVVRQEEEDAVV